MAKQTLTVQLMHAQARIVELEAQLAAAQRPVAQPLSTKPQPEQFEFDRYWDYVRAAKRWCNTNRKPVSYASPEQFDERACA